MNREEGIVYVCVCVGRGVGALSDKERGLWPVFSNRGPHVWSMQ